MKCLINFLIFQFSVGTLIAQNVSQGIIACYSFDGNAKDGIGNNDGIVQGANLTSDRYGTPNSAYLFDGINDFIEVKGNNFRNDNYSLSFWVCPLKNPSDKQYHYAISIGGAGGDQSVDISNDAFNAIGWTFGTYLINSTPLTTSCAVSILPELNKWQHIVAVRSNQTIKLYIDGKLVCESSTKGLLPNYGVNTVLTSGRRAQGGQFLAAKIDEIAIYNRALSDIEVKALYNQFPCDNLPTIRLDNLPALVCVNDSLKVSFSTTGNFKPDNTFTLQIAEESSNSFINIGTAAKTSPITIPVSPSLKLTVNYKIRVISSSPMIISEVGNIFKIQAGNKAIISGNATIEKGQKATLNINFEGIPPWSITLSDAQVFENIMQSPLLVEVSPVQTTIYTILKLETNNNCRKEIDGKAKVDVRDPLITIDSTENSIYIPDAFSPNSDRINDYFEVKGAFSSCKMTIFSRWGTAVFQTDDCRKGWDGKVINGEAPIGSYVYKIEMTNDTFIKRGTVLLIR